MTAEMQPTVCGRSGEMEHKPVCVVAGVGPGIGLAVAKRFAREGFRIAPLARRDAAHGFEVDLAQPRGNWTREFLFKGR